MSIDPHLVVRAGRRLAAFVGARAILVVGLWLIVATVAAAILIRHHRDPEDQQAAVLTVARTEATNFFSLDHDSAERDLDRVLDLATGAFREQYAAHRSAILASLRAQKLTVTAHVPDGGVGVEYVHGDRAGALVTVDAASRRAGGRQNTRRYRARLELTRIDGTWRVSDLQEVS